MVFLTVARENVLSLVRIINVDEWMEGAEALGSLLKICSKVICQCIRGIIHCAVGPAQGE